MFVSSQSIMLDSVTVQLGFFAQLCFTFSVYHKVYQSGLLKFCMVAEPPISSKSAKYCKIHKDMQTTVKFARNLTKYMLVPHNLKLILAVWVAYLPHKLANVS